MEPRVTRIEDAVPSIAEAQSMVGGFCAMISHEGPVRPGHLATLEEDEQLLVDEDAEMKNSQPNLEASVIAGMPILGDVLVLRGKARWT